MFSSSAVTRLQAEDGYQTSEIQGQKHAAHMHQAFGLGSSHIPRVAIRPRRRVLGRLGEEEVAARRRKQGGSEHAAVLRGERRLPGACWDLGDCERERERESECV